jgi:protein gp37
MAKSAIEWTEMTWNPTTGCNKISAGCKFCYAEVMSKRLKAMGLEKYQNGFKLAVHEDELAKPYTWKKPQMVFVNSMSDLFHKNIPLEFIQKVFKVMNDCPQHTFQVLTKRADRLLKVSSELTKYGFKFHNQTQTNCNPLIIKHLQKLKVSPKK